MVVCAVKPSCIRRGVHGDCMHGLCTRDWLCGVSWILGEPCNVRNVGLRLDLARTSRVHKTHFNLVSTSRSSDLKDSSSIVIWAVSINVKYSGLFLQHCVDYTIMYVHTITLWGLHAGTSLTQMSGHILKHVNDCFSENLPFVERINFDQ